MKSLVVITHGAGARNFVLGRFPDLLLREGEVHIWHTFPDGILAEQCASKERVGWDKPLPYRERLLPGALRHAVGYAQMYWADTRSMRFKTERPITGAWQKQLMHRCSKVVGRLAASPSGIALLARAHCRSISRAPEVEKCRTKLRHLRPSTILFGHYRYRGVLPLVLAARSLGIPTVAFIFSWDNLTCKGRISAPFDHYIVWSEHMRRELLRYYPSVGFEQVHVAGTPQFDAYSDKELMVEREEFFRAIGAHPSRPLICYSGGSRGTCPEDQDHLNLLMTQIRSGRIAGNPQVVLRPSPADDGNRYESVRRNYPELLYVKPEWILTEYGAVPTTRDFRLLVNLTRHSDLNINVASTMTLDFAICDKPVVNIGFDIASPPPLGVPIGELYYEYEHYLPVLELGAARIARSAEDLATHVNTYLENPALDREARRRLVELEVETSSFGRAAARIVETLEGIAAQRPIAA